MWQVLSQGLALLALAAAGTVLLTFTTVGAWMVWNGSVKPRLIPAEDIDRIAGQIVADYADPEEEAYARYARAWYESDWAGQTYWRRVRKAVHIRICSVS